MSKKRSSPIFFTAVGSLPPKFCGPLAKIFPDRFPSQSDRVDPPLEEGMEVGRKGRDNSKMNFNAYRFLLNGKDQFSFIISVILYLVTMK